MSDPFDRVVRAAARRGRAVGVCPEPDVLAAYLDNGLTSDERAAVELHSADCVRCQQHLGLLGAVSLDPEPAEIEAARSWLRRWGWLVPVATAVLVVAIWTRTPEPATSHAPATAPAVDEKAASSAPQPAVPGKDVAMPESVASPQMAAEVPSRERREVAPKAAPSALPAPAAAPPPAAVAEADRPWQLADAARAPVAASPPAPAADESKETDAAGARQEARLMRKAGEPALFAAASVTETYRVSGGRIERSRDGGATWASAYADPMLAFTAAACAPDGLCWFGTSTGVVVRTGSTGFVKSHLPEALPIAAITAGPGVEATVATASRSYHTTDGSTWIPVPR